MLESVRLDLLHEKTMAYLEAQAEITIVTKKDAEAAKEAKDTKETKEKKGKKK
jgi:hypothetical protein